MTIKIINNNINNQILEYDDSLIILKINLKQLNQFSIPFNVNIKCKYDEISQGMGLICPGYNSIKSQVTRSRRKQIPPDITTFYEIPNESKYYKTKRDENFMIFKNNDLIIKSKQLMKYYLKKLKKKSSKYNSIEIIPKIFQCDFEKAISIACQEHNYVQFLEFLEYFKKTYLISYETENWNYYDNIEHISNNSKEIKALVKYYKNNGNSIKKKGKYWK
ncbi:hypothetical protein H8356DRAFT_1344155 [Neocallimastix lanati (nom. inval.)]|nr:hypothetical protein H8356DRAFT_1344155 [Neocallimastix sp. JGI-2020a]